MKNPVPESVKRCLPALGCGLFALALAACSQQQQQQGGTPEPTTPVVEPAAKVEKPAKAPKNATVKPAVFPRVVLPTPFAPLAPGKRISHVNVPGPYVAVTFDDGPSAALTPKVLDIFNRHGARATFFVLGQNASRNRSILARAAAEGHEIGAHTWSHINMRASSVAKITSELDRTNAVIESATGRRPRVMRPPYGAVNPQLVNFVYNRYGTPAILWDVDTRDWRKPGVQTVINRAVGNAKPGSIILLHDIHPSTLAAVEGIVTGLQARGFKLVTVSELIAMGRRAAGASAPARESAPAPEPEAAASPAPQPQTLPAQQAPLILEGGASIGLPPAQPASATTPPPASSPYSDLLLKP